ncbi:amidohydrolase family protein [Aliifodinibius sp. S!AR15-10]|uniref:amidohydrolase family protein n=1 Tax=Aliifodinibius sp. S!AR15-10 TaxID=2950437 RepID=UPI0028659AED|nr:amidohydrolase family protein [Aliifodinibius sp. S!AR15-10]MDR8390092.1 amidohydrolase family protein [Aliifodinibius sp. S!AR15-10]
MKHAYLFTFLLLIFSQALAQEQPQVFEGARIIPIAGNEIENGALIVQNGKISAVGKSGDVDIPKNANVVDVTGKVIMPGLVDSHSHIGEGDGGDRSAALHPGVRILDAIDPNSDTFKKALAGGITSVNVMPGSGHLMSGRTVYLKLRKSDTIEGMLFVDDPSQQVAGGLKMANGTNPLGDGPFPGTRAKSAAMVRELFVKAQEYKQKVEQADGNPEEMPERDLGMETLMEVLNGKRIVHNHTHRHDDILTAIRLAKEFGYRMVLHHVSEAWKVADEIAEAGVPCSIIVLDAPGGKPEAVDIKYKNGAVLEEAGVPVGYHTDASITDTRLFLRSSAFGVRAGMDRENALRAVTIENAKMLDIEDRTGTLEEGKDADFIILSGDPLSVYTHVEETWVEGVKRFDRDDPEDLKYATGGYEVFRGEVYDHHLNARD